MIEKDKTYNSKDTELASKLILAEARAECYKKQSEEILKLLSVVDDENKLLNQKLDKISKIVNAVKSVCDAFNSILKD